MSFDPANSMNHDVSFEQPKSGKRKYLLAGCGCLGLLAVLCVGGGAFIWMNFVKPTMAFMNEGNTLVTSSTVAQEALGSPITTGVSSMDQNGSDLEIRTPVNGSKANGTSVLRGKFTDNTWLRTELYLEVGGQRIELNPDQEFNLDIDDGSQ